jgi:hypothetical protein
MITPQFASITGWLLLSGMTRTATYAAIARGDLRAIKQPGGGRRTLIDVEHGLTTLRGQPFLTIGTAAAKTAPRAA